jgi:hypothetical protein
MRDIPKGGEMAQTDRSLFITVTTYLKIFLLVLLLLVERRANGLLPSAEGWKMIMTFRGVVVLTLNVENFLETYGKLDIGKNGSISLISDSGTLMIRFRSMKIISVRHFLIRFCLRLISKK